MAVASEVALVAKAFARAVTHLAPDVEAMEARYDREADVLYVSFGHPQEAEDSELTEDDILLRYRGGKLIGFSVLRASRFGLSDIPPC